MDFLAFAAKFTLNKKISNFFKEHKINVLSSMKFTPELVFKDKSINKVKIKILTEIVKF